MVSNLKSIPVTLNLDFNQLLLFFEQLPVEHKRLILFSLENKISEPSSEKWKMLKGSVTTYLLPFEPVDAEDWEVLQ